MTTRFETNEDARANRKWFVVDASEKVVGRLASRIAQVLRGKNNPRFTPHNDCGDFVIVVNAEKLKFTGKNKASQKLYRHHTGHIGSLKEVTADVMLREKPEAVIRKAVAGMLPKTALGRRQLTKLKVYRGTEHPHLAQNPQQLEVVAQA